MATVGLASHVDAQTLQVAYREGSRLLSAISAVYKEAGLTAEYVVLPSERALISVESAQVDADIARIIGTTSGYKNMVECTETLYELPLMATVKKGSTIISVGADDLKKVKVAYVRGSKSSESFLTQHGLEGISTTDGKQLALMLARNRFDVGLIDSTALRGLPPDIVADIVTLPRPVAAFKLVHVLGQKWAPYCARFDSTMKAMKADGRWAKLIAPAN